MKEVWEFCRKLNNPERLGLLKRIYRLRAAGSTVNEAVEESVLGQSATSQYLKQLHELGLLRRQRSGCHVEYYADSSDAPSKIAEIACMMYKRFQKENCDMSFTSILGVMGNAARARMISYIAQGGNGEKFSLSEKYDKPIRIITRDLEPACDCGLLMISQEDIYVYQSPTDPIAQRIVELSA